ncbi:hypothetical protein MMC29_004866 [Sticta canariensis]|nr:hypothetical protein [Sticta canariensis]
MREHREHAGMPPSLPPRLLGFQGFYIRLTMLQTRWNIIRITRRTVSRQQRRFDSTKASSGHAASSSGATHHSPHPEPANEYLGRGFYITIIALPLSLAFYKFSVSSDNGTADSVKPALTRLISYYSDWDERWAQRNALYTSMCEQAARDRNLFQSTPATQHIDLRFPEIFNTGSPFNVPAGHSANLDELIAHYKRQNALVDEAREAKRRAAESVG